jgi:hypothetical protein
MLCQKKSVAKASQNHRRLIMGSRERLDNLISKLRLKNYAIY